MSGQEIPGRAQGVFLICLGVMVVVLAFVSAWSAWQGNQNHQDLLNQAKQTRIHNAANRKKLCSGQDAALAVMTQILTAAQISTDTDPTVPAAKKAASDKFVVAQLALIAKARC